MSAGAIARLIYKNHQAEAKKQIYEADDQPKLLMDVLDSLSMLMGSWEAAYRALKRCIYGRF